ncbi:MAG: TerD family protein [Lachnospiraceae bacterium]|nr:TerD family protein [Lachnospiraceae bacterium]
MGTLQELFDSNQSEVFSLSPGEYEGPLVINRPCRIEGHMATLWALKGPVLRVLAKQVTLKDLRIEVTQADAKDQEAFIALESTDPDVVLENVEVRGNARGIRGEAEHWPIPYVISFGAFAAEKTNTFKIVIESPGEALLDNPMNGMRVNAEKLLPGRNELMFEIKGLRDRTLIFGDIFVKTKLLRRIQVSGRADKGARQVIQGDFHVSSVPNPGNSVNVSSGKNESAESLISANDSGSLNPSFSVGESGSADALPFENDATVVFIPPVTEDSKIKQVGKGQRVSLEAAGEGEWVFLLDSALPRQEIDAYVFLLQENGKVKNDEGLLFFGNPVSEKQEVRVDSSEGRPLAVFELSKMPEWVQKGAVCFSIYGEDSSRNFSLVKEPVLRVLHSGSEVFQFPLTDLRLEKTFVAVEVYRYKGAWKMSFVGAGYQRPLKYLCESYGVEVAD